MVVFRSVRRNSSREGLKLYQIIKSIKTKNYFSRVEEHLITSKCDIKSLFFSKLILRGTEKKFCKTLCFIYLYTGIYIERGLIRLDDIQTSTRRLRCHENHRAKLNIRVQNVEQEFS